MRLLKSLSLYSLLLFSSCGYRWEMELPDRQRLSVSVPFIPGDDDGLLTKEIILSLTQSGIVDVKTKGAEYTLKVNIVGSEISKIGFRIDPQKVYGKVRKNLLNSEERQRLTIEAALMREEEIAFGPYRLTASADYDFVDGDSIQDLTFVDSSGQTITVLPFSLGQLEPKESASLAAHFPLYRRLAQKIVDAISSNF